MTTPASQRPAYGRALLGVLGALLSGGGVLVVGYALTILVTRPILFIVAVPFAVFGLLVLGAGLLCLLPWWRARRRRRSTSV